MVGDIVEYIDDWKKDREWFLYDLYSDNLCKIVLVRDGKFTNKKNGENRLNPSIVNLSVEKIKLIK